MVNKIQERIYVESAAKLLGVTWQIDDIAEPPDFLVVDDGHSFGLEVRQVFADRETFSGSPSKRKETLKSRTISRIADVYYSKGGLPVSAKFLGSVSEEDVESIARVMLSNYVSTPWLQTIVHFPDTKIYVTALPSEVGQYRRWVSVSDRVEWVRSATQSDLQYAIDRKTPNLALYKQKFSDVVLLLVAERLFNSGRLALPSIKCTVTNPGYSSIYFLSHPEAVARIA